MTRLLRPTAATLAALLLACALAACGDGGSDDDGTQDAASGSPGAEASSEATGAGPEAQDDGTVSGGPVASPSVAADAEEFCAALQTVYDSNAELPSDPTAEQWSSLQADYAALGAIGTPADASAEQSEGLDILVATIAAIDLAEARAMFASGGQSDLSADDEAKVNAFTDYSDATCGDAGATP